MEKPTCTVTEALADKLRHALNALPVAHRVEAQENEVAESREVEYVQYAFKTGSLHNVRWVTWGCLRPIPPNKLAGQD